MYNNQKELFDKIKGKIIVSCQALPDEPLYVEEKSIMYLMARAAKMAGTPMIRTNSVRDVIAIKEETNLPVIGIIKIEYENFEGYITPTMKEIDELVEAGADIIALDATRQKRGDNITAYDFIKQIKEKYPNQLLMGDIADLQDGIEAQKAGCDIVGTTLNGYTSYTEKTDEPNFDLVRDLVNTLEIPVICEGHINTPEQAKKALEIGALAVVVGSAITRPYEIAKRFMNILV